MFPILGTIIPNALWDFKKMSNDDTTEENSVKILPPKYFRVYRKEFPGLGNMLKASKTTREDDDVFKD